MHLGIEIDFYVNDSRKNIVNKVKIKFSLEIYNYALFTYCLEFNAFLSKVTGNFLCTQLPHFSKKVFENRIIGRWLFI